jgi:C4-dicarboxylate-specific signal transduction histidine kinase
MFVTFVAYKVIPDNQTTAGFAYLLLVLVIASTWGFLEAALSAILASLAFAFFFVPPPLTFAPVRSEDWVALFSFLATSLIGSQLSATIKRRTSEAIRAEETLRQVQADLAHVSRVTALGELSASLAHEVNQPIAAAVTDANTCLRWLARDQPDLEEAREAACRMAKDATRAADIVSRIRLLFKKHTAEREPVDVNEVIREMIALLISELTRYSITIQMELAPDLPQIIGDRVQLQQVLMNLMMNSMDAMKAEDGRRELVLCSQQLESGQLMISVSDTGVGLPAQHADQIFDAFFTTKPQGTGMGLRISRSIVESHGGRMWAADNDPRGASFYLTLPAKIEGRE